MNNKINDVIVGIDPDIEKNGVCVLVPDTKSVELFSLPFPLLLDKLKLLNENAIKHDSRCTVVVEASWKVAKSNYHHYQGRRAEKIAKNVGANHEAGRLIVEMCKHWDIEVVEQYPLKKLWKGRDGKITHEEIATFINLGKKSNQETRDAALLAWHTANLPIRLTSSKRLV